MTPRPDDPRQRLGLEGEREAARFLRRRGLRILETRFRCRMGEIDLIALDGEVVVFAEVKARAGRGFGSPAEAITAVKRRRMARVAQLYLSRHGLHRRACRFDVVEVVRVPDEIPEIRHIRDAFRLWPGG